MASILSEISRWATALPYWEQAALDKIISGTQLADDDYAQLLNYLLEDAGLAPKQTPRPLLSFLTQSSAENTAQAQKVLLKEISELTNVNALATAQRLTFHPQLTAIFGANGSGKSGYARVIASAAFTRGDKQVLPDVTKPLDESPITANLVLSIDDKLKTVHYVVGQPCLDMRPFYVFDSTSVHAHLEESNPMSFAPAGLSYLTRLVETTDLVRTKLQQLIAQKTRPNSFIMLFQGETPVSKVIKSLGTNSDISRIRQLASLSTQETARINELDRRIAELKSRDSTEQVKALQLSIHDLETLQQKLQELISAMDNESVRGVNEAIIHWRSAEQATQKVGIEQFERSFFTQTGTEIWHQFISSAQELAKAESTAENHYPQPGDRCLLCQQVLSEEAHNLILQLFAYAEGIAQKTLTQAIATLEEHEVMISGLDTEFYHDQAVAYRYLYQYAKQVAEEIGLLVIVLNTRKQALVQAIRERVTVDLATLPNLPENPFSQLQVCIDELAKEVRDLEQLKLDEELSILGLELLVLQHRQLLSMNLEQVEQFVTDAKWVTKANSRGVQRSTAHITRKYNQLFDALVTQEYLRLFGETLHALCCPLHVKVQTRAQKGQTVKRIVLKTDDSIPVDKVQPDKVLSEGEQRAVALADFLTEVALDQDSSGIVLDDPVTSLDFAWKEVITNHLIEQAVRQQVIVFTHDLHFLYCLKDAAIKTNLDMETHWIERRDDTPGWVFLNNSPVVEGDYKTSARAWDIHKQANKVGLPPEERERLLKEGFGALRATYEAFVIYEMFASVVMRFGERISIERLKDVYVAEDIVITVIDKVGLLSRYIEGHLHSDQYVAQKPTPQTLFDEIEAFDKLRSDLRNRRKAAQKATT